MPRSAGLHARRPLALEWIEGAPGLTEVAPGFMPGGRWHAVTHARPGRTPAPQPTTPRRWRGLHLPAPHRSHAAQPASGVPEARQRVAHGASHGRPRPQAGPFQPQRGGRRVARDPASAPVGAQGEAGPAHSRSHGASHGLLSAAHPGPNGPRPHAAPGHPASRRGHQVPRSGARHHARTATPRAAHCSAIRARYTSSSASEKKVGSPRCPAG